MSDSGDPGSDLTLKAEEAERRLEEAARAAAAAERRATAELEALEAKIEERRQESAEELERLRRSHAEELQRERSAREEAIAAAQARLTEIEAQAESAEKRVEEAERRVAEKKGAMQTPRRARGRARQRGCAGRSRRSVERRNGDRQKSDFDVAVVGGGAAGLWAALEAAEAGGSVCLISRTPLSQSASFWAQGGLAAALEPGDTPARHAADTIAAGRSLCRPSAVQVLVDEAPAAVEELQSRGVVFDLEPGGELALGLEGGHTRRRIVHAGGSQTGHEITSKLAAMVADQSRIEVREKTSVVSLWSDGERCHGVVTDAVAISAAATVMATGGAAALWRRTTNPWGAIGAGPVFASAAGADLADLEFCQFHPTALSCPAPASTGR